KKSADATAPASLHDALPIYSPHDTPAPHTTVAPTEGEVTPGPTASTTPANSWPSVTGGSASTRPRPNSVASLPHTPQTPTRMRTSPGPGSGTGLSSIRRSPTAWSTD